MGSGKDVPFRNNNDTEIIWHPVILLDGGEVIAVGAVGAPRFRKRWR